MPLAYRSREVLLLIRFWFQIYHSFHVRSFDGLVYFLIFEWRPQLSALFYRNSIIHMTYSMSREIKQFKIRTRVLYNNAAHPVICVLGVASILLFIFYFYFFHIFFTHFFFSFFLHIFSSHFYFFFCFHDFPIRYWSSSDGVVLFAFIYLFLSSRYIYTCFFVSGSQDFWYIKDTILFYYVINTHICIEVCIINMHVVPV